MLRRPEGDEFTTGRAAYFDHDLDSPEPTSKIFVRIKAESLAGPILAQLDTGAAWTMLDAEVADAMSLLGGDGEPVSILAKGRGIDGRLERTSLEIVADEGDALTVDATVFVSPEWRQGTFLGYMGLLEHIRFAVDPRENEFHFGPL